MIPKTPQAKLPENRRMQEFLASNGISAVPKYIRAGSLKGCWRLYNPEECWSAKLATRLNALGFTNYNGRPFDQFDGNGGTFSVFARGHDEFLQPEGKPLVEVFAEEEGAKASWRYIRHPGGMVEVLEGSMVVCFWAAPVHRPERADLHEGWAKQIVEDHNARV